MGKEAQALEKADLVKIAEELHQEAFDANSYYLIMLQYRDFQKKYGSEMRLSPAFYQVVYGALMKACFMEIAKLYDSSSKVVSVGYMLDLCRNNINLFPEYRDTWIVEDNGTKYSFPVPYQHHLKPEEECFFRQQVESQRRVFEVFDVPSPDTVPVSVDLTFPAFLDLYLKRFRSLSKKQENIRKQRNTIYAHNDEERIKDIDSITKKYPISYPDIKELIDFALDCTGLIIGSLTDVCKATQYSNINDWEGTLMLAKLGLKYQEYDQHQTEKAFMDELKQNLCGDKNIDP